MSSLAFYSGFFFFAIFIAYIAFFVEATRRELDEEIGFIKLWWMIGAMELRDSFDVGVEDKRKIVLAKNKIKVRTYFFAFFMVAFSLAFLA
ncbi:MAG: hypothetical protein CL549_15470 [Alcanivorax sp.]|nr:hypothetical protein [Alcanivorax sp.]MAY11860.1 hypothetical protein [Alcanivorax sp.]|tara:strand:- start:1161 stop:1433 length:273 start_codon:yes stop_codon:yes gene_type:complete